MYTPILNGSKYFGNNRWHTYSPKLKRYVWLYSDLEYDYWALIETNPRIITFCEQARKVYGYIEAAYGAAIFDMWLLDQDNNESFIEVKYSNQLVENGPHRDERSIWQIKLQQDWCSKNGYPYKVVTENEIRKNRIFLENMKSLLQFYKLSDEKEDNLSSQLLEVISNEEKVTMKKIHCSFPGFSETKVNSVLAGLYIQGSICGDFDKTNLGYLSEVWLNDI